jgi:hypothetical protein
MFTNDVSRQTSKKIRLIIPDWQLIRQFWTAGVFWTKFTMTALPRGMEATSDPLCLRINITAMSGSAYGGRQNTVLKHNELATSAKCSTCGDRGVKWSWRIRKKEGGLELAEEEEELHQSSQMRQSRGGSCYLASFAAAMVELVCQMGCVFIASLVTPEEPDSPPPNEFPHLPFNLTSFHAEQPTVA